MSITGIFGKFVLAGLATVTTQHAVERARNLVECDNQGAVFYLHAIQRLSDPNYTTFLGTELAKVRVRCSAAGGRIPAAVGIDDLPTRILDSASQPWVIEAAAREMAR